MAEDAEVPDLTGSIIVTSVAPVFVGTYSHVYKGIYNGTTVAIKVLREVPSATLHAMRRKVFRERKVWAQMKHLNIIPLCGYTEESEMFGQFGALISPWYGNGDAARYLDEHGQSMSIGERIILWQGVVAGVSYLHAYNPIIIHGDLKPTNILIDDLGVAKLCDFGLTHVLSEQRTGMTTTTEHTGTERYLAPELVTSDGAWPTRATDVYAVGCLGLDFLFLQRPYENRKNGQKGHICMDIMNRVPPATKLVNPVENCELLWNILESCWVFEATSRTTAADVLVSLQSIGHIFGISDAALDHGVENPSRDDFSSTDADDSSSETGSESSDGSMFTSDEELATSSFLPPALALEREIITSRRAFKRAMITRNLFHIETAVERLGILARSLSKDDPRLESALTWYADSLSLRRNYGKETNDTGACIGTLESTLAGLEDRPSRARYQTLSNLGALYIYQYETTQKDPQDIIRGTECWEQAYAISMQIGSAQEMYSPISPSLGDAYFKAHDIGAAGLEAIRNAIKHYKVVINHGPPKCQRYIRYKLGRCYSMLYSKLEYPADFEAAINYLNAAISGATELEERQKALVELSRVFTQKYRISRKKADLDVAIHWTWTATQENGDESGMLYELVNLIRRIPEDFRDPESLDETIDHYEVIWTMFPARPGRNLAAFYYNFGIALMRRYETTEKNQQMKVRDIEQAISLLKLAVSNASPDHMGPYEVQLNKARTSRDRHLSALRISSNPFTSISKPLDGSGNNTSPTLSLEESEDTSSDSLPTTIEKQQSGKQKKNTSANLSLLGKVFPPSWRGRKSGGH